LLVVSWDTRFGGEISSTFWDFISGPLPDVRFNIASFISSLSLVVLVPVPFNTFQIQRNGFPISPNKKFLNYLPSSIVDKYPGVVLWVSGSCIGLVYR
jgi:hypothetical protein